MPRPKILAFAGSSRRESFNRKLIRIAADAARQAAADVTLLELADYPLPLYNGDLERDQGIPENAKRLKQLFIDHQGLLLSCPEYNSSITPLLKNTIDWVSRPEPDEPSLVAYKGKIAALMSASPGALGGLRGLVHVRSILGNIGVIVLPDQFAVPKAADAFDDNGQLKDKKQQSAVENLGTTLAKFIEKINEPDQKTE